MTGLVLAIDQGTTSSRALVLDSALGVRGVGQVELPQHFPGPGLVEHDGEEIWTTTLAAIRAALAKAGVGAEAIAAIGITNQRETTLIWDRRTGKPIHRAIVWQDRRTAEACQRLVEAGAEPTVRARTGTAARSLLLGDQDRLAARQRARRSRARPAMATSLSARSTHSCSGASQAVGCTRPTRPMPRAHHCSTFMRAPGTTNCCACSMFPGPS